MVSFFLFIASANTKLTVEELLVIFVLYAVINISLFYLNFLVLIPKFLDKKKYGIYAFSILVTVIVYGLGKYGVAVIFKQVVLARSKGEVVGFGHFFLSTIFTSLVFFYF